MLWIAVISVIAGAVVGTICARWLRARKPAMASLSLILRSAALLPAFLVILILLASLYSVATMPSGGESGYPIAIYLLLLFGVPIALLGLLGGLVAAAFADRLARR